jgi:hypothetical protein
MIDPKSTLSMPLLEEYLFVDCLLVDWSVDPHLKEMSLTVEAYGKTSKGRSKGLLSLRCVSLFSFASKIHPEAWADLGRPYSSSGEDQRANEIVAVTDQVEGTVRSLELSTDMLELRVRCAAIELSFSPFSV